MRPVFIPLKIEHAVGWLLLPCSALWVIAGVTNFSRRACFLKLNTEGFTTCWLFLSFNIKWSNVKEFRTGLSPGKSFKLKTVVADVFDLNDIKYNTPLYMGLIGYLNGPGAYYAQVRAWYGADIAIVTNYGLSAMDLVSLLNKWRISCADIQK
jgi:hypothetical protein